VRSEITRNGEDSESNVRSEITRNGEDSESSCGLRKLERSQKIAEKRHIIGKSEKNMYESYIQNEK